MKLCNDEFVRCMALRFCPPSQAWLIVGSLLVLGCGPSSSGSAVAPPTEAPSLEFVPVPKELSPRSEKQHCIIELGQEGELPLDLSSTGCFESAMMPAPAADLIPYEVNSPLWTDGAIKERYIVLSPAQQIDFTEEGEWGFPEGSVLLKNFAIEFAPGEPASRRTVETRVMLRTIDNWRFASYRWTEDGAQAERVDDSLTVTYEIQHEGGVEALEYMFPGPEACNYCHGKLALGPQTDQLNAPLDGAAYNPNQLAELERIGVFSKPLPSAPQALSRLAVPSDEMASKAARARAYLHGNCAHCHQPGGWTPPEMDMDLRHMVSLAQMRVCNVPVQYASPFPTSETRVVPGDAANSNLPQRMNTTEIWKMPSTGATTVDPLGIDVVSDWIHSLEDCR